ncbi:NACHT domain-containing protein [Streptomyces sp. NPDC058746]|uniref:NACHT domain-containing protein n=1 Tax=Streptomyces sp. NPDC058746 TaxID=3346622 RepID=UPI0036ACD02F
MSDLLNGRRAKPPHLDEILPVVRHCRETVGVHIPPGVVLDDAWWRARLAELETTAEARPRTPPRHTQGRLPIDTPVEAVTFDFSSAVQLLAGRRPGFDGLDAEILEPLDLVGGATVELRGLFDGFGARVRACRGTARTALLCAADVVLLVTAFCDEVARVWAVRDTEAEQSYSGRSVRVLEELERVVLGSVRVRDPAELREEIASAYAAAADAMQFSGPAVHGPDRFAMLALCRYERLLASVTWDCPELRLTSETYDPDEAEVEGRRLATADQVGLIELGVLLREFANGDPLTPRQRERLRAPIAPAEGSGPTIPSLAAGYVNPGFRVSVGPAGRRLAADDWWERQPLREDIAGFLAAHLLGYQATQAPLLVLGHPGSGKSLLTRLIAARLPESEFTCLHVELRHVPAELDLQEQLEEALYLSTGRRTSWPEAAQSAGDTVRVVLLDGLDELIQAGAGRLDMSRQWRYLTSVEQLQQREYELGRPVVFVVTSRTVVADQVLTPPESTVLRLEPFDDARIARWLEVWETTNRSYFTAQAVEPLSWETVRPYRDLARHSLLLIMLSLYDAVGNPLRRLGGRDIRRADLYERLLVEFVRRQVVKHHGLLPPSAEAESVGKELRRLGVIAIGMFNRRSQSMTADEADEDLHGLLGEGGSTLLFGRFFFVHEAQAVVAAERLSSYEFLHATFGEYLAARLICEEVGALAESDRSRVNPVDDRVLQALLSFAPLTDRAEVLDTIKELCGPGGQHWHPDVPAVLRTLFRRDDRGRSEQQDLPYRPLDSNRTERDAVYGANLLLLALLVEDGVHASGFLSHDAPVERWWRCVQFWRSQLGEASWEQFARTVSVERRPAGKGEGRGERNTGDLWITLRGTTAPGDDLAWTLSRRVHGPAAYHDARGVDTEELTRRLSLLCDTDVQQVLHALAPLMQSLPGTLRTYRIDEDQNAVSGAHALVALLCRDTDERGRMAASYLDVLEVFRHLPDTDRAPVADVLVRHLPHDRDLLPDRVVRAVLLELIRIGSADGAVRWAGLWPALEAHLVGEMGRADREGKESEALVTLLTRYRELFSGPLERLLQLLREAGTSAVWAVVERGPGHAVLEQGRALLHATPPDERPSAAVVGLLRLARELGQEDWLLEHAEPLLLSLEPAGLLQLRPTDIDGLRSAVRDPGLAVDLQIVAETWRGRG